MALTVKNASCGSEELDGVLHETAEADYSNAQMNSEHHEKFWVNPKTGWISKSVGKMKMGAFESTTTQLVEPAPDLSLPTPAAQ